MNFLAIFQRLRQMVVDIWQRTEKRDRNRFFVISGVSAVVLLVAIILLTRTTYTTLAFGKDLDTETASEITAALTSQGIKYQREADGSISVPERSRQGAVAYLTENGIPKSGNKTYEIYALGNTMTSNSEQQRQYKIYQDEDDIRRFVRNINGIANADVKIAVPDKRVSILYSDITPVTASIHLMTKDGSTPNNEVVRSVKAYAANAVSGLLPENVVVTCQEGLLLGDTDETYSRLYADQLELENHFEADLEQGVRSMLNIVAGYDNYTVKAHVTLDTEDVHITDKVTFVPTIDNESGIIESMETIAEEAQGLGVAIGEPGTDENGGGDTYDETETTPTSYYKKTTSTVNNKISEIREHIEDNGSIIRDITFSVIFDNTVYAGDQKFTNNIKSIIGGTLGLLENDYDRISVMYEEFKGAKEEADLRQKYEDEQKRKEFMDLLRIIVLYLVIGACVVLLILKTYGLLKKEPTEEELLANAIAEGYDPELDEVAALVEMATLGEITEAPKSPFREQIEKFIDKNPTAVAELLRNWLNEDY